MLLVLLVLTKLVMLVASAGVAAAPVSETSVSKQICYRTKYRFS